MAKACIPTAFPDFAYAAMATRYDLRADYGAERLTIIVEGSVEAIEQFARDLDIQLTRKDWID